MALMLVRRSRHHRLALPVATPRTRSSSGRDSDRRQMVEPGSPRLLAVAVIVTASPLLYPLVLGTPLPSFQGAPRRFPHRSSSNLVSGLVPSAPPSQGIFTVDFVESAAAAIEKVERAFWTRW